MSGVGFLSTLGTTADFTVTRDKLIEMAYQNIGVLPEGQPMSAEQLQAGIDRLGLIIREVDESGKWRWTVPAAFHLSLAANVGVYDATAGLKTNVSDLISVVYRAANGRDSDPLEILSAEAYECLPNKLETGVPRAVYLTDSITLPQKSLFVWPMLSSVAVQSAVDGTDGQIYKCIYPHMSSATTMPTTGANWRMVWELSSGASTTWASGVTYTMTEALRIVARRPIADFDSASDTPDIPPQMLRTLLYRLCDDLADAYPSPQDDQERFANKYRGAFRDIFPSTRQQSTNIHNKVKYF
jgi:hypothetical protein